MDSKILVSAIIPNYNHGRHIEAAVLALRRQSRPPEEIIIVDDGSTDNSLDLIQALYDGSEVVKLIRHVKNQGTVAALNSGMRAARGEFVYMGAADDVCMPELIEVLLSELTQHSKASFASAEVVMKSLGSSSVRPPSRPFSKTKYFSPAEVARLFGVMDNFILTGAALWRLSAVRDAGYLNGNLGSLADGFLGRQLAFSTGFVYVPKVLSQWNVVETGYSRSSALSVDVTNRQLSEVRKLIIDERKMPSWYWPVFERRFMFATLRIALAHPLLGQQMISAYAPGPYALRPLFPRLRSIGKVGHLCCLVWATIFYRPTSLWRLIKTKLLRAAGL